VTTPTAQPAPPARLGAKRGSVDTSGADRAMPGGPPLPPATAPRARAWSRTTRPRGPARNRRKCLSRLLPLGLIATAATAAACGGNPTPPDGAAREGRQVFVRASCGGCHTLAAADARGNVGPNLDELQPDSEQVANKVRDGGNGMPAFADRLTDREIQSVAAYVAEVAGRR
jgi:mono/diheme cytochrome c family protein